MDNKIIKKSLISWYDINKRDLPWRIKKKNKQYNPYHILVSEFMLQQTTVSTVKSRYNKFISLWPDIYILSKVSQSKILKFWSGLGYYNRAINLLKCVKIINKKFNSVIPNTFIELTSLPGIGKYTANAILGIAYNKRVMAIDSNVERIISRIYCLRPPISKIKNDIENYSKKFISLKRPGDMIQCLMDFGSLVCLPRNPLCNACVIKKHCIAFKKNLVNDIPYKKNKIKKIKKKKYTCAYILINNNNEIFLKRRSSNGMLPTMLEVPNGKWILSSINKKYIDKYKPLKTKFKKLVNNFNYSFSHFDLNIKIYYAKINKEKIKNGSWYPLRKINSIELPTIMKKVIKTAL